MELMTCQKCLAEFYTASPTRVRTCPYCGYSFLSEELTRRRQRRAMINKYCVITKGGVNLDAVAVDISPIGVGITAPENIPLLAEERVHVSIEELDVDAEALVVWTTEKEGTTARAGLAFSR